MAETATELRLDHPLRVGMALHSDSLNRRQFAGRVAEVLKRVSREAGLTLSIEGTWGSGKTSLLAMVEELVSTEPKDERPVVVHFNPWLVGDRDALLRQFLASIAKHVKLTDHAKEGKRVAKELKTYAKAFDVLKLIPGAEPWASIVKSVVESMGNATEAVFDYKTPDIEAHKQTLELALRKFPQRIVVLIDDLDRLFPAEVYEMVRIVKAVGDLPNIGYVLAWDASYVSAALDNLQVPFAAAYLDKIVQVRLPIPPLSFPLRITLMTKGLGGLPVDALKRHFPNGDDRHGSLFYHGGLAELMEQPRDVVRLFDVVSAIEPGLRGEIHLADIIGLACLMTKAPKVYEFLHRVPQAFVGRKPGGRSMSGKPEDTIKEFAAERDSAINACASPNAVRVLVYWLFPVVAKVDDSFTFDRTAFSEGHLAHPERLLVALHLSVQPDDVSLVHVQQYLLQPDKRNEIASRLEASSCVEFVRNLGLVAEGLGADIVLDTDSLSIAIARLVESDVFLQRSRARQEVFFLHSANAAIQTVAQIAKRLPAKSIQSLTESLITDSVGLSVAATLALRVFSKSDKEEELDDEFAFKVTESRRDDVLLSFANNVSEAARTGGLFEKSGAGNILWAMACLDPKQCKAIFQLFRRHDSSLDRFVESYLRHSFDSNNGQSYGLPTELGHLEVFVSLNDLKKCAEKRLKDETLGYPTRAAWRSIVEGRCFYGKDGSAYED